MKLSTFPQQARIRPLRGAALAGLCAAALALGALGPLGVRATQQGAAGAVRATMSVPENSVVGVRRLNPLPTILTVYLVDSPERADALRQYLARPPQEQDPSAVLLAGPADAAATARSLAAFRAERGDANVRVVDLRGDHA